MIPSRDAARWHWRSFPPAQAAVTMTTYPAGGYVVITLPARAGGKERQRHLTASPDGKYRREANSSYVKNQTVSKNLLPCYSEDIGFRVMM